MVNNHVAEGPYPSRSRVKTKKLGFSRQKEPWEEKQQKGGPPVMEGGTSRCDGSESQDDTSGGGWKTKREWSLRIEPEVLLQGETGVGRKQEPCPPESGRDEI